MNSQLQIVNGVYIHYKGAKYRLLYFAKHSETLEDVVVYQQVDDESKVWVRPREMFFEDLLIDNQLIPRFKFIN